MIYTLQMPDGSPTNPINDILIELNQTHPVEFLSILLPRISQPTYLDECCIPQGSTLIGIGVGGYAAANYQEQRPDLTVIALLSPDTLDGIPLLPRASRCLAIYSDRASLWTSITPDAYDLPWITHDHDAHKQEYCLLISTYLKGQSIPFVLGTIDSPLIGDSGDGQI